jgi:hypothetical protein
MTSPLIAKKIGEKVGIILNSEVELDQNFSIKNYYNMDPTRIVLLTNIAAEDEVDDDLLSEVKEECSKFGEIMV